MKGKTLRRGLSVFLTVALAAAMFWAGFRVLETKYVFWNGSLFPKDAQSLSITGKRMRNPEAFMKFTDLRRLDARDTGMTAEQYEWFRRELPDCTVVWDIPVQGKYYTQDTRELHVEALTESEIRSLQYLPRLKLLDVGNWADYPRIRALQQQYPQCTVRYRIGLSGEWWDSDVVSLALTDADPEELAEKLGWFENLKSVLLTGTIPEQKTLARLQAQYPQIFFLWKLEAFGMTMETDLTELDLSPISLGTVAELESLLPYFPNLGKVKLNASGLNQEELAQLARDNPRIHFVYNLIFEDRFFSTDAEEMDLSNLPMEDTTAVEAILPIFHDLKKVVMCNCGIGSEDMDALNRKYEDIRFVWSVDLGGVLFRTDAVHFAPNRWGLSLDDENIYDLRYCTDMVCVDIGHSVKVTNCDWAAFMPELKYLVLAETGISDLTPLENHENLKFLELFLSKVKDYSPLTTVRSLEDLNLCYTQGDPTPIGEMTWLKRLWWSGHWKARKTLADKLPDTEKQFLSLSSTGKGWREGQHYYDMRDFIGMEYMTG